MGKLAARGTETPGSRQGPRLWQVGNGTAKSHNIFRDFINAVANVMITERDILVRFEKRGPQPLALLMAAGFAQTDLTVPWVGKKRLQLLFG